MGDFGRESPFWRGEKKKRAPEDALSKREVRSAQLNVAEKRMPMNWLSLSTSSLS